MNVTRRMQKVVRYPWFEKTRVFNLKEVLHKEQNGPDYHKPI